MESRIEYMACCRHNPIPPNLPTFWIGHRPKSKRDNEISYKKLERWLQKRAKPGLFRFPTGFGHQPKSKCDNKISVQRWLQSVRNLGCFVFRHQNEKCTFVNLAMLDRDMVNLFLSISVASRIISQGTPALSGFFVGVVPSLPHLTTNVQLK